ncbi:MAG: sodium-dependent transporter [Bacteroidota bacterium]
MSNRTHFSSRIGFIAAAAGSAVGLGNIWKFPYETAQNGGGAFFFVYLLCILLVGLPVMIAELTLGRHAQANPWGAYHKIGGSSWAWVGGLGVICGIMILSFYNVVAGWSFGYFLQIGFGDLLAAGDHKAYFGEFTKNILPIMLYALLFMGLTTYVVGRGVKKGLERAATTLMPVLLVLLLGLIAYALTLENAWDGVAYYLSFHPEKLNLSVINSAMGHAFFSLSLGMGGLITYGSYLNKKENLVRSATVVTLADTGVAFLAGLLMLPLVFTLGQDPGMSGPGLAFVTLPSIFASIGPVAGKIVGAGFFLLLTLAALTSTISLLETPVAYLIDEKKWSRNRAVVSMGLLIFGLGIPTLLSYGAVPSLGNISYAGGTHTFLDLVADIFSEAALPFGGLMLSLFVVYRWKMAGFESEIQEGFAGYKDHWISIYVNLSLRYLAPIFLGLIFLSNILEKFFNIHLF